MKMNILPGLVAATAAAFMAFPTQAQIRITEVAPWGSTQGSNYLADWFELTNIGTQPVSISSWKMDDSSNSFASATALLNVTSIAAGQAVVFIQSPNLGSDVPKRDAFLSTWFGQSPPPGLEIGIFRGSSGAALDTSGDSVNIFNGSGVLQASVSFGASPSGPSFPTFDNTAGLNNQSISLLSATGINLAASAVSHTIEIGSPGTAIVSSIPEPQTYAMLLAGLALVGAVFRKRREISGR